MYVINDCIYSPEPPISKCQQQSSQNPEPCGTVPCDKLHDGNETTCVAVPHNNYPWGLRLLLKLAISWTNCGTFNANFNVTGKGLSCIDQHTRLGFHGDHDNVDVLAGEFKLCEIVGEHTDAVSHLVTCSFTCVVTEKIPSVLLLLVTGKDMEVCEIISA